MVANYAIGNDMLLISTKFQHKINHAGTWTTTDHQTVNQIDYVMVSNKIRLMQDVR